MNINNLKKSAAYAAIEYIPKNSVIGIGTGTTVLNFIKILKDVKHLVYGAVSSSKISTMYLKRYGIPIINLNEVNSLPIYVDGADEVNSNMQMIKGGGGALTGEKIVAAVANKFICIVDETKKVSVLGRSYPVPIEIIPMAKSYLMREFTKLGGKPQYRRNFITDNGNIIIDIYDLKIVNPIHMEKTINSFTGVVTVGLFALRSADIVLISTKNGIEVIQK